MGRFGLGLLVMTVTAAAFAAEPSAPSLPYAHVALTDTRAKSPSHSAFESAPLPAHPVRASLTSSEVSSVGAQEVPPRAIRVVLDSEASVASFPIDSEPEVASVPVVSARPRLLSIRRNLDDDDGVFERVGITHRLIRRSIEDSSDLAPVSAARRLRTTLD